MLLLMVCGDWQLGEFKLSGGDAGLVEHISVIFDDGVQREALRRVEKLRGVLR